MIYHWLNKQKPLIVFFIAALILCLLYRISFFVGSLHHGLENPAFTFMILSFGLISDFVACLALTLVLYPIYFMLLKIFPARTRALSFYLCEGLIFSVFFLLTTLYIINQRTLESIYIGLNYTILLSYLQQGMTLFYLYSFLSYHDLVAFIVIIAIYFILKMFSLQRSLGILIYFLLPVYLLFASYGSVIFLNLDIARPSNRVIALYASPLNHIVVTFFKSFNKYSHQKIVIQPEQLHSVKLIDDAFVNKSLTASITQAIKPIDKPWNIVIFVLESVSSAYIFDTTTHKVPMPFLDKLSKQGLWFNNHYTTGNISALSQFGIFTGIYPNPTPCHFEMQQDLNIPTLANWLRNYDSFLVSASNDLYFSVGLNKTFAEYANADSIDPKGENLYFNMFLNENEGMRFFLQRVNKAKEPFLGIYWSGAAHYPYKDYADQHEIVAEPTTDYDRYLNNLYLLDQGIQQTYEDLRKQNLLEHTLFIVIGDHGEMFGQHDYLGVHGRSLYQEEIKVPLLIYAPALFKPEVLQQVTSSVDIVPTLLEWLNVSYGSRLQGESLLNQTPQRKYIFIYGEQDEIAAIDQAQMKMQISFSNAACVVYDLKNDPQEYKPLPCHDAAQLEAILKFRNFQPKMLERLSLSSRKSPSP